MCSMNGPATCTFVSAETHAANCIAKMKMTTAQTAKCCLVFKSFLSERREISGVIPTTNRRKSCSIEFFDGVQQDTRRLLLTKTGHVELFSNGQ